MSHIRAIALASLALLLFGTGGVPAARAGTCTFVLGFKAIRDQIPATVGDCTEDEGHNPANGDAVQRTTRGLFVWRKADNVTAFTDGYRSWVDGPYGLQQRLNAQRFSWEDNTEALPLADLVSPDTSWRPFLNKAAGFSILYPPTWVASAVSMPANSPVQREVLAGKEGEVDLAWGTGFGGACSSPLVPLVIRGGTLRVCHGTLADGRESWGLIDKQLPATSFDASAVANLPTPANRAVVLGVVSTLAFTQ